MATITHYISKNLSNFSLLSLPAKFKLPSITKIFAKKALQQLDKAYYLARGFLDEMGSNTIPIPKEEFDLFKDLVKKIEDNNNNLEENENPALFKMKVKLIQIYKVAKDIEAHFVDSSTLDETDYLTINQVNKDNLDESIKSDKRVEYPAEEFLN
jgi:hypothetical protein